MIMIILLPTSKKISNRETGEYVYFRKVEKKWGNFLCFPTYLISFQPRGKYFIITIYFHEVQKK